MLVCTGESVLQIQITSYMTLKETQGFSPYGAEVAFKLEHFTCEGSRAACFKSSYSVVRSFGTFCTPRVSLTWGQKHRLVISKKIMNTMLYFTVYLKTLPVCTNIHLRLLNWPFKRWEYRVNFQGPIDAKGWTSFFFYAVAVLSCPLQPFLHATFGDLFPPEFSMQNGSNLVARNSNWV